jgi:hypothetical protein
MMPIYMKLCKYTSNILVESSAQDEQMSIFDWIVVSIFILLIIVGLILLLVKILLYKVIYIDNRIIISIAVSVVLAY